MSRAFRRNTELEADVWPFSSSAREVDRTTYQRIQQNGYRLMSERDLHQLFAEAVVSSAGGIEGRSDAYEIITGIREMKEGEERTLTNPIFQHVITRQRAGISSAQQAISKVPLKMQLADSASIQEAADKIRDAFREKLQSILQLDKLPELEFGPDDLGMDSLIAVEIRNWFMKEVNVDMRECPDATRVIRTSLTVVSSLYSRTENPWWCYSLHHDRICGGEIARKLDTEDHTRSCHDPGSFVARFLDTVNVIPGRQDHLDRSFYAC